MAFLTKDLRGQWMQNEPMSRHTTWRIGGPADLFVDPADESDLAGLVRRCREAGVPWLVVGIGSNLLVSDNGIRGVVIHLGRPFADKRVDDCRLTAGAGCTLPALARFAAQAALQGLEFASGIPASLGGAVAMNAGAHSGSMQDVVGWVDVMDEDGAIRRYEREEMDFSYRHSRLQGEKAIVIRAGMELCRGDRESILRLMEEKLARRKKTQPLDWPNAGSVFLNPPGDLSAGRLIETAGLKGFTIGGAQVSEKHANFIVNRGGATAADVLALIEAVRNRVKATCGIELRSEVRVIGDAGGQVDGWRTEDSNQGG
ncbi:UDP-N-acetylmuramate dehydrogenase [Heliobacterium gestii]|uniref:UDP-N-acetylenolpyruvoylglucosamine reductase n=2 Tax=Heliomicrobium gestii TaxID=2699 RepID=A0A845LG37_HELGE|nr:UDP-N-acetylmuramate dehydrogenase [Heliomicrobium gestii]